MRVDKEIENKARVKLTYTFLVPGILLRKQE